MDITSFVYNIYQQFGIFDFVAPFLLIFSLIYGILRKTSIFLAKNSNQEKNIDKIYAVIALSISLYYVYSISEVVFTQYFLSFFSYELIVLFFILMAIGLLNTSSAFKIKNQTGSSEDNETLDAMRNIKAGITGGLSLLVLFAFLYATMNTSNTQFGSQSLSLLNAFYYILVDTGLIYILIFLGLMFGVIYWMTSQPNPQKKPIKEKAKKYLIVMPEELGELVPVEEIGKKDGDVKEHTRGQK